jgi:cytosine deaminase
MPTTDKDFMDRAIVQAMKSAGEGGLPVGAVLRWRDTVISEGHNQRQQKCTVILHGETDCIAKAGLFGALNECVLYTTLSPCMMCSGTIIHFKIPRVVIADTTNFSGNEDFLRSNGVQVDILKDTQMIEFFSTWKEKHPEMWDSANGR